MGPSGRKKRQKIDTYRIDVRGGETREEAVVMLDAFSPERGGITDPLFERDRSGHKLVEVVFGEDTDRRRHGRRI